MFCTWFFYIIKHHRREDAMNRNVLKEHTHTHARILPKQPNIKWNFPLPVSYQATATHKLYVCVSEHHAKQCSEKKEVLLQYHRKMRNKLLNCTEWLMLVSLSLSPVRLLRIFRLLFTRSVCWWHTQFSFVEGFSVFSFCFSTHPLREEKVLEEKSFLSEFLWKKEKNCQSAVIFLKIFYCEVISTRGKVCFMHPIAIVCVCNRFEHWLIHVSYFDRW